MLEPFKNNGESVCVQKVIIGEQKDIVAKYSAIMLTNKRAIVLY